MKFQDDISMPHTHTRTSRNQYVPHFFKVGGIIRPGPEVVKLFSFSTQLSMKFTLLINAKMIVGILTLISRINDWL